jgi:hypothetical protein
MQTRHEQLIVGIQQVFFNRCVTADGTRRERRGGHLTRAASLVRQRLPRRPPDTAAF